MTDEKCYVFNDGQNNALTTALLANGGNGMNGAWNNPIWALAFLGILGNGGFGGNWGGGNNAQLSQIQDTLNTNQGNTLLMNAISGNATSIKELASSIGCDFNAVQSAINGVQSAICGVGNQLGMSSAQVINAINNGNMAIANQISQCCCDAKTETLKMGYENQINNLNQSNMITKGFGDITNSLTQNNDANTRAVLAKMDAIEDSRKDREIATLTAQLATVNARAERQAELAPIYQQLNDIKCRQPETVTIPYSPVTGVPSCVAWNAMLYGGYPYGGFASQGNVFS